MSRLTIALGLATAVIACVPTATGRIPTAPTGVGDPSPGYVRIVSIPPQSSFPLTIWFRDPGFAGNLSTVYFEFAPEERILVVFPSTPGNGALQLNDNACEGGWSIASNVEPDVLL